MPHTHNVNYYTNRSSNNTKSFFLLAILFGVIIAIGFLLSQYYQDSSILYIAVAISLLMNIFSYWYSDKIVLSMANARSIKNRDEYRELWDITENLCITAGLQMPKLYIIEDPAPNAFATGRNEKHAVVAVTTGLLQILNKSELEGVVAHELSHIGNKDMLLQTIVVVISGAIAIIADIMLRMSVFGNRENKNPIAIIFVIVAAILMPIAATIVQLAISRKRELLADSSAVLLTRYPEAMANALLKISSSPNQLRHQNPAMNHIYFFDPVKGLNGENDILEEEPNWFARLFMTHPPVKERVEALLGKRK